jgi:hypothetical protein
VATEDVRPNALQNNTNWTGTAADIDEDVGGTYDGNLVYTSTNGATVEVLFDTSSGNPTTGANEQAINICVTRTSDASPGTEDAGGNDPSYTLEVSTDDGTEWTTLATGVSVTTLDQVDSYNFTYPVGTGDPTDGSQVAIRLTSSR